MLAPSTYTWILYKRVSKNEKYFTIFTIYLVYPRKRGSACSGKANATTLSLPFTSFTGKVVKNNNFGHRFVCQNCPNGQQINSNYVYTCFRILENRTLLYYLLLFIPKVSFLSSLKRWVPSMWEMPQSTAIFSTRFHMHPFLCREEISDATFC